MIDLLDADEDVDPFLERLDDGVQRQGGREDHDRAVALAAAILAAVTLTLLRGKVTARRGETGE